MPSEPGRPERTGIFTCLGFCWGCVHPVVKRQNFRQLKLCLGPSWFYQVSFSPPQSRRRRLSSRIFKGFWQAALLPQLHIIRLRLQQLFQRISFSLGLFWFDATPPSRRWGRSMMVHSWCWRGLFIVSSCRLDPGSKRCRHTDSSPATLQRILRPPTRRAGVARRTPPSSQQ